MIRTLAFVTLFFSSLLFTQAQTYLSSSDSLYDDRFGNGFKDYKDANNNSGLKKVIEYGNYTIVCGQFDNAFGMLVENIALYDKTTKRWHALGAGLNGTANDMIIHKGELIVVGEFTFAGQVKANRIAKFNFQTQKWSKINSNIFYDNLVKVAVYKDTLIACSNYNNNQGYFETYCLSDTTWKNFVYTTEVVRKMLVANNKLYLAGAFNSSLFYDAKKNAYGAITNGSKLISYDNGKWSSLNIVSGGLPTTSKLYALEADASGNIYIGGDFDTFNGASYMGVLKYDGIAWSSLNGTFAGYGTVATAVVYDLAFFNNRLYAGGVIPKLTVNNTTKDASNLMFYENGNWNNGVPNIGNIITGNITSISTDNDTISAVGTFTVGTLMNMVQVNKLNLGIKAGGGLNIGGVLTNIEVIGDDVFFNCTDIAHDPIGQKFGRFAKLNLVTGIWDTTFRLIPEVAIEPTFLTQVNGSIYTAGKKTGTSKYAIYVWSDKTHSFSQFGGVDFLYPLSGISFANNKLITSSGGYLYLLNGTTWSNSIGISSINLAINAFSTTTKKAYFGGISSTGYPGVFSFDGNAAVQELGFGNNNVVNDIHIDKNGYLYVGGKFSYYNTPGADNILKYDPVAKTVAPLGGGISVGNYGTYVSSITSIGDTIFVSGEITGTYDNVNGTLATSRSVSAFLPSGKWNALSPNINMVGYKALSVITAYKKGLVGSLTQYMPLNSTSSTYARSSEGFWDWNIAPAKSFPSIPQVITANDIIQDFSIPNNSGFYISPNPAKSYLNLDNGNAENLEGSVYTIYNMAGIASQKGINSSGKPNINIENLPSGLYVMQISMQSGLVHSLRFIKE